MTKAVPLMLVFTLVLILFGSSLAPAQVAIEPRLSKLYERYSPDAVLKYMEFGYSNEKIGMYQKVLHEQFLFVFTPEVADSLGLPPDQPWWGKTNDVACTRHMFYDGAVVLVMMELTKAGDWIACHDPYTGLDGLCCRLEPDIRVLIDSGPGEMLTLWVNNSWLDIMVVADPDHQGLWKILRIEEIEKVPSDVVGVNPNRLPSGDGGVATETMTWGLIKALYR